MNRFNSGAEIILTCDETWSLILLDFKSILSHSDTIEIYEEKGRVFRLQGELSLKMPDYCVQDKSHLCSLRKGQNPIESLLTHNMQDGIYCRFDIDPIDCCLLKVREIPLLGTFILVFDEMRPGFCEPAHTLYMAEILGQ